MGEFAYPKLKGFKIGQLNITNLVKHVEELRIFIHEQPIDILYINETWLDNSISSAEVEICGYEIVRRDRNRNGGGVAIYLCNNIPYVEQSDLIPENVEALCLEIRKPKSKPVLVSTWYRPPDSNIELLEWFEKYLKKSGDENKEIIITGDL
jgi:exonuclease III